MSGRRPGARARLATALPVALLVLLPAAVAGAQAALPRVAPAAGPALEVSVALPAGPVTVGDLVAAVITLRVPAARLAAAPRFPVWRDAWGEAEVRERGLVRRDAGPGGVAVYSQRLVLAAFRPGRVELPPAQIAVPLRSGTVQAPTPSGLALAVRSVLPPGKKDLQPRPPAPLSPLPPGAAFFYALAGLAAVAAAGLWMLWRRRRRRRTAVPAAAPPLAPLAELLAGLDRLAAERSPLVLHTGLSQALRRYLGRTLDFPAPESTTSEIQRRLASRGWPSAEVRAVVELLRACDLVKFARQQAGDERGRERLAAARGIAAACEAHARVEDARASLKAAG
jgi:hypothetical protein